MTKCMVKNHTLQKQKFIIRVLFFLVSALTLNPTTKCVTILIYYIYIFYSIDITYKYNKFLLIC